MIVDWSMLADALLPSQTTSLVIAPATILSETGWLKGLAATQIEPAAWAAILDQIIVLAATAVPDALAVLQAEGGASDLSAVQERLTRRFGSAAAVPIEIDPMVVATLQDIRVAERRLLRGLVKGTDGFMARHFDRRISLQISRQLAPTSVTPSQITLLSTAVGLCGAPFFLSAHWSWQTVGALLFLLHSIVDGCDGELARLKFQESRYGGILDVWGDNVVHVAIFACIAAGWALSAAATWPLWLGTAAIVGTLGSAGFVYWRQLRVKDGSGPLFYIGFNRARRPSRPAHGRRVTPRLHLFRGCSCAVRQVELVSAFGLGGGTDILFLAGSSCSARAVPRQIDNTRRLIAD